MAAASERLQKFPWAGRSIAHRDIAVLFLDRLSPVLASYWESNCL